MNKLFQTLAPLASLAAGAALLSACGGAPTPVNAAEVPAAVDVKPSAPKAAPVENATGGATSGTAATGAPAAAPVPSAAMPSQEEAKPVAAKPTTAKPRKMVAKKAGAEGACGAGTCG